jgi:hypothetical protein
VSYCRMGNEDSDLYCFANSETKFETYVGNSGPFACQCFCDSSLSAFRKRLLELRDLGYRFPDDVLERIDKEMREEVTVGSPG